MQNNSPVDNFWAEMHLDGAQVDQLLCKPGEAKIFEGFKEEKVCEIQKECEKFLTESKLSC